MPSASGARLANSRATTCSPSRRWSYISIRGAPRASYCCHFLRIRRLRVYLRRYFYSWRLGSYLFFAACLERLRTARNSVNIKMNLDPILADSRTCMGSYDNVCYFNVYRNDGNNFSISFDCVSGRTLLIKNSTVNMKLIPTADIASMRTGWTNRPALQIIDENGNTWWADIYQYTG